MKLVRGAWKLLVGVKDALVLVAMLLFFGSLFAALSARPGAKRIGDGALVLKLNGAVVEQPEEVQPFAVASGQAPTRQFRLRDLVRAIDRTRDEAGVKATSSGVAIPPASTRSAPRSIARAPAARRCSPMQRPIPIPAIASPSTPTRSGRIRWAARRSPGRVDRSLITRA